MPAFAAIGTALGASAAGATAAGIAATTGVAGTALALKGGRDSIAAQKDANAANLAAQKEADRVNYARWLMSRGIGENGQPVNHRSPVYSQVTTPFGVSRRFKSTRLAQPAPVQPQPSI